MYDTIEMLLLNIITRTKNLRCITRKQRRVACIAASYDVFAAFYL